MIESKYLQDNMQNIQKLMNIPTLKHFEIRSLAKLLKLSRIREYTDGEVIISEGDNDHWIYFLLAGKITIKKQNIEIASIDKKGEIFGEMRIIDSMSRSASVYAVGNTVCLAVDTTAQKKLSSDNGREERLDFLLLLYRIFAEYMSIRLRLTSDELVKAKKQIEQLTGK
jgi:CRP-like cAMP-binding protein